MRLIACETCHAQYDLTGVISDSLRCRCGKTLENRELVPVDAEIRRCGACGALVVATAEDCSYCGSEIVQAGDLSLIHDLGAAVAAIGDVRRDQRAACAAAVDLRVDRSQLPVLERLATPTSQCVGHDAGQIVLGVAGLAGDQAQRRVSQGEYREVAGWT